jgi:hypothetical protein
MRIFSLLLSTLFLSTCATESTRATNEVCNTGSATNNVQDQVNGCLTFTVGQGTGCVWMCNYCATNLGTYNYYFTGNPPVCTYQTSGCVGSPVAGQSYTCCTASESASE